MSGLQIVKVFFALLVSPNTKQVDNKRLSIELSALKQLIWDNRDDCDEEVDGSKGDYPRWIDTSAMLSVCLTKTMTSCRLIETLSTGILLLETSYASSACRVQFRSCEAAEYVENVKSVQY